METKSKAMLRFARSQPDRIFVDVRHAAERNRYGANHGIARYSREVTARLTCRWEPFDRPLRAASPPDVLNPRRLALKPSDLLYSPGFSAGLTRCTQLLTLHDLTHLRVPSPGRQWLSSAYYDGVVKPAVKRTGHVLTVSEVSANAIREWLADDRVEVHNAGIGCSEDFTPAGPAAEFDRPYFLYVGNIKPHKNIQLLFEAMAAFPDHYLVAVLAAADVIAAASLAHRYGFADRLVVKTGLSDAELAVLYRGAEALAFPSRWEGVGLPVIEAMMTGTKVVYCSAAQAVADICAGSQFGVDDPDDADRFAAGMAEAIRSPFDAPAGLDQFQWDSVAHRVEAVIRGVREATRRPAVHS